MLQKLLNSFSSRYSVWLSVHLGLILLLVFLIGCSDQKEKLNVFTWAGYVNEEIRTGFEEEFGVTVIVDTYGTNEDLLTKLSAGATGYDIIMPSDYMVTRMIDENLLAELNHNNIPNFQNLNPVFLDKYFDPKNKYSVPYTFGTAGIAYDSTVVSPAPDSWSVFWDEQYKNKFSLLDDPRETPGVALKLLGYSINTTDLEQLGQAKEKLFEQKPLVKQYKSEAEELLIAGDVVMAHCWSGDAFRAADQKPEIKYVIPKEGSSQFIDNVCIPKDAPHKELAEKFIDYLLRPEINAKITTFTKYGTCVEGAKEHLPEELQKHEYIYPSVEVIKTLEWIKDPGEFLQQYNRVWEEVKAR